MVPASACPPPRAPRAARCRGRWQLRITCISGSESSSTISLSSSVVGAGDLEADLLAGVAGDLAHHARQLVEHLPQRDHAHFEDARLQLVELALQGARLARSSPCSARASRRSRSARSARPVAAARLARSPARPRCSSGCRACGCPRAPSALTDRSELVVRRTLLRRDRRVAAPRGRRRGRSPASARAAGGAVATAFDVRRARRPRRASPRQRRAATVARRRSQCRRSSRTRCRSPGRLRRRQRR